jgi:hypothetical protein
MDLVEKAGFVVLGWTALSLVVAVGWSRFMCQLRRKEHMLAADRQRRARKARRAQVKVVAG